MDAGEHYTLTQAALVLGLSRGHVQGMLWEGALEGRQDEEGQWRVPADAVHGRLPDQPLTAEEAPQRASREPEEGNRAPTPEEFQEARRRELARLDVRLSLILGREAHTTPEDLKALSRDTPELEARDRETVRRWCSAQKRG